MIDPNISDDEKKCLRILAKRFLTGSILVDPSPDWFRSEGLNLDRQGYVVMLKVMEGYGAIERVKSPMARTKGFKGATELIISAAVVPLVKELDESEKKAEAKRALEAAQAHERAIVELANQTKNLKPCPHCSSYVTPTKVKKVPSNGQCLLMLLLLILCFPLCFLLMWWSMREYEICPNCKRVR